ncbi:hypothetical protein [uncultured Roseobacter sp.]|uniref:hypothetical protein n=1 Tax=uncultured Roseobacter sp. TaxID=114847 RepID=UPI0026312E3D|nr:hypothetical protein [uncultured Roseobacter sp.]
MQKAYDNAPLTEDLDEMAFANDLEGRLTMVVRAYADGDAFEIDKALGHVSWTRRMKRKRILDLIAEYEGPDEED